MHQPLLPLGFEPTSVPTEPKGVVYTKPWVVDLVLDLAGYTPEKNLADMAAVEPSVGEGAFVVEMARRLVASCRARSRSLLECESALLGFELDERSAAAARRKVVEALENEGVEPSTAQRLASRWIRLGDYLLEAGASPKVDFVIGNPPYVRLEEIPESTAALYRSVYQTMRGRADLYVAFFEAGLRQLRPNGVCAFICADRWMLNQYGADLRRLVTSGFGVETIVEMHKADAFDDDVSAYPAVTVIRRAGQGRAVVAKIESDRRLPQAGSLGDRLRLENVAEGGPLPDGLTAAVIDRWFQDSDPWPCGNPARLAIIRGLEDRFEPLESQATGTRVGIGVATGLDKAYITSDPRAVESERLLKLAIARDTTNGRLEWSGRYLVNPWDHDGLVDLDRYPRLRRYFERYKTEIRNRNTAKRNPGGWYRTIDRVEADLAARTKLYIPDIKDRLNPVLDQGETYPHHNLYYVVSEGWDLEVLGGLLLSSVCQLFVEAYGVRMRGGYLRFQAQYLRRIRVPRPQAVSDVYRDRLISAFRNADREAASSVALEVYGVDRSEIEHALTAIAPGSLRRFTSLPASLRTPSPSHGLADRLPSSA